MNPQTQNRLVGVAIGAGTIAYLGVRKPWKKTESKTDVNVNGRINVRVTDVPESKLPSPDIGRNNKGMLEKDKSVGKLPGGIEVH